MRGRSALYLSSENAKAVALGMKNRPGKWRPAITRVRKASTSKGGRQYGRRRIILNQSLYLASAARRTPRLSFCGVPGVHRIAATIFIYFWGREWPACWKRQEGYSASRSPRCLGKPAARPLAASRGWPKRNAASDNVVARYRHHNALL